MSDRHLLHKDATLPRVDEPNLTKTPATGLAKVQGRTLRVLLVDDYEPFRRFLSQTIQQRPGLQIIGEAGDGLRAVRRAQELKPDLILLDIGLPSLNGIEAAQRIRELLPQARIIFVSQESDPEIMQESLAAGGNGYVVKARAATELLSVIDAVLVARY
jgi:DNA-binding NarL/FixJ family response regulator